jgi:hypothetical protein
VDKAASFGRCARRTTSSLGSMAAEYKWGCLHSDAMRAAANDPFINGARRSRRLLARIRSHQGIVTIVSMATGAVACGGAISLWATAPIFSRNWCVGVLLVFFAVAIAAVTSCVVE